MSVLDTIKSKQLLKGIALDVYEIVTQFANLTAGEIAKKYEARRPKFKRGRNEIAKRVRDLEVWGAIKKTGTAVCEITGKNVATYAITGNIPVRTGNTPTLSKVREASAGVPKEKLAPIDVAALLESKNAEIATLKKDMNAKVETAKQVVMETLKEARALDEKVGVLLTAVAGGENHFQALRNLQAEKVKKVRSFFTSKARKAELKKELDAIEYILNTTSYIKDFGSVA